MNAAPPSAQPPPLADRLMRGMVWTVTMRWGIRILGLASMMVLVRLLNPEDFGLLAMAMAVIALAEILTNFGVGAALIRNKHAGPAQFNTAWTVRQGQLIFVALIAVVCAPLAASYYEDPRITDMLRIVAVSFAIRGFENIGVINFQRELMFHRDFLYRVSVKLSGVLITIGLAVWLRSYWALILGMVANSLVSVALSYWMSSYRPWWSLTAWRELWGFSQWVLSQGFARYLYERADVLFLGRLTSADNIGYYSVSSEIAALPATEISLPVSRAVFPGLAQLVDEPRRLEKAYLNTLNAVATITIPIGLGMAAVAEEFIVLAFGEKWLPAVGLLQVFAIFSTFGAINSISGNLLVVLGHIRYSALVTWVQATVLLVAILPAFEIADLVGVAMLRASLSLLGMSLVLHFVVRTSQVNWPSVMRNLYRPIIAGTAMFVFLFSSKTFLPTDAWTGNTGLFTLLIIKTLSGGLVYSIILLAIWRIANKPDGIESTLFGKVQRFFQRTTD